MPFFLKDFQDPLLGSKRTKQVIRWFSGRTAERISDIRHLRKKKSTRRKGNRRAFSNTVVGARWDRVRGVCMMCVCVCVWKVAGARGRTTFYFNFFLGRSCDECPHLRLRQLVARGGRRA